MTPSFGHPTNPPARKYWCSEVADVMFNIFIVQKTTRNLQKSNSTTILQSYQTNTQLLGRVLGLAADASGSVGQEAPARKEAPNCCARQNQSLWKLGMPKIYGRYLSFFFLDHVVSLGGAGGGQPVDVKQIVFGATRRPGTSTRSRPVKAPGPCNIRSLILPTGHTSQGVTWLQGNHSPSMVAQKDAFCKNYLKNLDMEPPKMGWNDCSTLK